MAAALVLLVALVLAAEARAADTTPPGPPQAVFVSDGEDWQTDAAFHVWWHNPPDQETPIAVAHYELCPSVPAGPCTVHQDAGDNISETIITVPYDGWFWVRIWLEDAAGNVDPYAKSEAVMLRYDDEVPGAPFFEVQGWLNASAPSSPVFPVERAGGAFVPVSKILGYSITIDGSTPDNVAEALAEQDNDVFPAEYAFTDLPEGVTEVRVRTVSNAGVPSDATTSAQIKLDRSSPTVTATGLPDPGAWQRQPVVVELAGTDQPGLSGMAAAPLDRPVEEGGHLWYRLDGGTPGRIRGGHGQVEIGADGRHTLAYRAYDVAGNPSAEAAAQLRIDRTPPEGAFEASDPADPQRLAVRVLDATSGVAGGRIEYRREGDPSFTRLPTTFADGRLVARIDDSKLPAASYELRALAFDVAGNSASIAHRVGGGTAALSLPVRAAARLEVAARVAVKRCTRVRRLHAGRRARAGRRCRKRVRRLAVGRPVRLAHGRRFRAVGQLATRRGMPLAGARVVVEGQLRSGGQFSALRTVRTDPLGNFRVTIPAGPSRTVRLRFAGNGTVGPVAARLVTRVRAAARLRVDRRRLRNGQAVRFRGRLLGQPIPAAGKVVALQARVGRRWRTFATPRANARGVFRYRYRFTSTTGVRRYAFRALVTREAAYPYERGASRTVRVLVRGR